MSESAVLRDFERADQPVVRQLLQSGMRERWSDHFDPGANPDTDDLWAFYIDAGGDVVVVEVAGRVVATGTVMPEPDGAARIIRMSVDRAHRRRGLGTKIVAELVKRAKDRGLDPVRVTTDTPWTEAVRLYEACGFEQVWQDVADTHFVLAARRPRDQPR